MAYAPRDPQEAGELVTNGPFADTTHPEYDGYAAALVAYGNRSDVESLVARRRREQSETLAAADFVRDVDGTFGGADRYPGNEPAQT